MQIIYCKSRQIDVEVIFAKFAMHGSVQASSAPHFTSYCQHACIASVSSIKPTIHLKAKKLL
jgi:hypothetical protein